MRFLITGVTGLAGRHLAERLLSDGHEVFGTTRWTPASLTRKHGPGPQLSPTHLFTAQLHNRPQLEDIVRTVRPDGLFHLAAFTNPSESFDSPDEAYQVNLHGSLAVFAAVRATGSGCRVVWVGSSHVYGQVRPEELPIKETNVLRPLSPYAVSKAAADLAAYQWSRTYGLDVVRLRPFNHTGPGQSPEFVCSDFARQLVAVERGQQTQVSTGNLEVVRDFTDVRDVVAAYVLAWEHGETGEAYNVCSGVGRTPREILDLLLAMSRSASAASVQRVRHRSVDVPMLVGSPDKLHAATGWTPRINWEQTLQDLLDDWRQRLDRAESGA